MSMKSGGSESTSNFPGSLVGSTVDFGVGGGGGEVAERVFDIRRVTDSNRSTGNADEGVHAMETGGKWRLGIILLMLFFLTSTFLLCFIIS